MSKEEILSRTVQADSCNDRATTWEEDYAGGTCEYIRSDLVLKAMTEYAHQAIEEAAEAANIRYTSCGDPMTCACQGTCDHLMAHIDKKSILKLKEKY